MTSSRLKRCFELSCAIDSSLLLPDRHALLTIRNLTPDDTDRCSDMNVITVRRTVFHGIRTEAPVKRIVINGNSHNGSIPRRSFRELTRRYFARESSLEFAVEAMFFVIIVAISAWPILTAAGALHEFFQRALI